MKNIIQKTNKDENKKQSNRNEKLLLESIT